MAAIMASEFAAIGRPSTRRFQTFVDGNIAQADSGRGGGGVGAGVGCEVGAAGVDFGVAVGFDPLRADVGRGLGFADGVGPADGDVEAT
jgi:hypothetical protein